MKTTNENQTAMDTVTVTAADLVSEARNRVDGLTVEQFRSEQPSEAVIVDIREPARGPLPHVVSVRLLPLLGE